MVSLSSQGKKLFVHCKYAYFSYALFVIFITNKDKSSFHHHHLNHLGAGGLVNGEESRVQTQVLEVLDQDDLVEAKEGIHADLGSFGHDVHLHGHLSVSVVLAV